MKWSRSWQANSRPCSRQQTARWGNTNLARQRRSNFGRSPIDTRQEQTCHSSNVCSPSRAKEIGKILSQTAPTLLSKLTPIEQDYRTIGSVFEKAGKTSKAKKFYLKAHNEMQGNIAALVAACQIDGAKTKLCKTLAIAVLSAGPVILENGAYHLKPEHAPGSQIDSVLAILETCSHGHTECAEQAQRIRKECDEIANGIQAANERLQSAMDSLQPNTTTISILEW